METTNIIETTVAAAENAEALLMAEETTAVESGIGFTPENLAQTAPIMGKGMLGIFIVMGIIILCVTLLNHFGSPERKQKREAKKAAKAQTNAAQQNK